LSREELSIGGQLLAAKVRRYRPRVLQYSASVLIAPRLKKPKAVIGRQEKMIGETIIWVLPNPSGLNAHYQARATW